MVNRMFASVPMLEIQSVRRVLEQIISIANTKRKSAKLEWIEYTKYISS